MHYGAAIPAEVLLVLPIALKALLLPLLSPKILVHFPMIQQLQD